MAKARENTDDSSTSKGRMDPNYFIAIRLSDSIHSGVKTVQKKVLSYEKRLEAAFLDVETLHLTLLTIHLKDEQIEKAKEILQQCRTEIRKSVLPSGTFTLKFKGVDFRFPECENPYARLLYVKPSGKEGIEKLEKMHDVVRDTFTSQGIPRTDPDRKFHPHVTVINLNTEKASNLKKKGISKIPEESFSTYGELEFGEEQVSSLHLCSVGPEMAQDGFYNCVAKIDFETDDEINT